MKKFELINIEQISDEIESFESFAKSLAQKGFASLIHCQGGQDKRTVKDLKKRFGKQVIWSDSLLPKWFSIIRNWIPSQGVLLQLDEVSRGSLLVRELSPESMIGLYLIREDRISWLIDELNNRNLRLYDSIFDNASESFIYEMDESASQNDLVPRRWSAGSNFPMALEATCFIRHCEK